MGEVYLASAMGPEGVERPVAIKLIRDLHQQRTEMVEMFVEEAKVSFLLIHPNIVQTYEIGQVDGHYFLVLEYVDGVSLEGLLRDLAERIGQPLPLPFAIYIAGQAARGLDYAHSLKDQQGRPLQIVHRDVSPGNVLLSKDGQVKVSDFGLAKSALRRVESQAGVVKGKLAYMAPEQLEGRPVGPAADIFALGVVLFEMLSGRNPFGELSELTISARFRAIPSLTAAAPHVPAGVAALVDRCLRRAPEERPASARELGLELDRCMRELGQGVSNYELAEFIERARVTAQSQPQAPHPFDQALGMALEKVAGEGGVSTFIRASAHGAPSAPAGARQAASGGARPAAAEAEGLGSTEFDAPAPAGQSLSGGRAAAGAARPLPGGGAASGATASGATAPGAPSELIPTVSKGRRALLVAGLAIGVLGGLVAFLLLREPDGPSGPAAGVDGAGAAAFRPDGRVASRPSRPAADRGAVASGSLHVRPRPPGGEVRVGGQVRGTAPLSLSGLPVGEPIRVEISLPGHRRYDQQVTLEASGALVLEPELAPLRAPRAGSGTLSVNSEPWSEVYVDGKKIGSTPIIGRSLPAGRHRIRLHNPLRKLGLTRTITIQVGQETRLSEELK